MLKQSADKLISKQIRKMRVYSNIRVEEYSERADIVDLV